MTIDIGTLFTIDGLGESTITDLTRIDRRSAFELDDEPTSLAHVVAMIPTMIGDGIGLALENFRLDTEGWMAGDGATIINNHADAFLQEGVSALATALLHRVSADIEDVEADVMDASDALDGLRRLLDLLANAAQQTGRPPTEVAERELGAHFATADASEWSDNYGEFLAGEFADRLLPAPRR